MSRNRNQASEAMRYELFFEMGYLYGVQMRAAEADKNE